ncbi:MAG: UvrD-helicase domain-containing protein [Candidatus Moraniibacteriota bacterium]|nr:MAG: UvrD-helicase domain-containing protein [Candidatus Moranbacteria bacterium]
MIQSKNTMEDILFSLNEEQKEAVLHTEGPLLILAGAGSGKTKTLTHRIAHLIRNKGVSGGNIMSVTFTNKAAEEMRSRLAMLTKIPTQSFFSNNSFHEKTPLTGTFHSICSKILRQDITVLGREKNFHIVDTSEQEMYLKRIIKDLGFDAKQFSPKGFLSIISAAKNKSLNSREFSDQAQNYMEEMIARAYEKYEDILIRDNALDFDDLLLVTMEIFQKKPNIVEKYQQRFKYILVDEYQDTNNIQYRFIATLAKSHRNICAVGDDWQSIYAFRGADIRNILDFEREYPDAKIIHLEQNYRSTQIILDAAHGIISQNKNRKEKKLWTDKKGGKKIIFYEANNESGEAQYVADSIKKEISKNKEELYKNFAVLYRTNAQSRALEEIFLHENIPYKIVGGLKFYDRKEIKDMIAYFRFLLNPTDQMALIRIVNEPKRGIGKKTLEMWLKLAENSRNILDVGMEISCDVMAESKRKCIRSFCEKMKGMSLLNEKSSLSDWAKNVYKNSGYEAALCEKRTSENEARIENISELFSVLSRYDELNLSEALQFFLEETALIADSDQVNRNENVVHCMTMHSAKGLEFDHVFIVGTEENILPHSRSSFSLKDLEEERRLMYVGITRAKKSICLLYARQRMLFGSMQANPSSRFLSEIPEVLVKKEMQKKEHSQGMYRYEKRKFNKKEYIKERKEERNKKEYKDGERISHNTFGSGVIVSQNNDTYTIVFQKVGIKKISKGVDVLHK